MNKKLIAAAVSAAVVAPVASQADVVVYGNITNAIVSADTDSFADPNDKNGAILTESRTDIDTVSSRVGIKASSDLGNGMTANGRYEWATGSDNADQAFGTTRLAKVGLSGSFGSVDVGQQWSTFYNTIGSMVSPNYSVGVPLGGYFRTGNTIQYTNSFGPVNLGLDIRADDDEGGRDAQGDGVGVGITFNPASNLTVGLAYDSSDGVPGAAGSKADTEETDLVDDSGNPITRNIDAVAPTHDEGDSEIFGIAVKATFGGFWASAGYQSEEVDGAAAIACVPTPNAQGACDDNLADYIPGRAAREEVETDYYQLWVGGALSDSTSWTLGYGESEEEQKGVEDITTDRVALAVNHKLGGGMHLFFEYQDGTTEQKGAKDLEANKALLGFRINF
ncbi:MAG: porin [bacterium]